jgi:hypothetical protein
MEIRQVSRWRYELSYYPDGGSWMALEGPTVFGLKRAQRRARRDLRKLARVTSPVVAVVSSAT